MKNQSKKCYQNKASYKLHQTNIQKVFTAGDIRGDQSLVVWAINEGRECARKVGEYFGDSLTV